MYVVETFTTVEASTDLLDSIQTICDLAFDGDFSDDDWQHALGGVHMVVCDDGLVLAHGAVVARELEVGDRMFRSGYVEAVAVRPDRQRSGLGSLVMKQVNEHIRSRYEFGALATGEHSFYERLGWQRWAGPSYVRSPTGLARTADEDDGLMVLPTGTSADVDLDAPISCESRRGDDW